MKWLFGIGAVLIVVFYFFSKKVQATVPSATEKVAAGANPEPGKISDLGLGSFLALGAVVVNGFLKTISRSGYIPLSPEREAAMAKAIATGTLKTTVSVGSLKAPSKG